MNEEMKEIVSDVLGDGNWKIFVGLDTNYHCKTSPSYFDSMFYAFYKNTSEPVSYTHLDVYKRQCLHRVNM